MGHPPVVADGARSERAENLYRAGHLGTGAEVAPVVIDWQDSDATIRWYKLLLEACPHGQILLWQDQAAHHTSDEVEEGLEQRPRLKVIPFRNTPRRRIPKRAPGKI